MDEFIKGAFTATRNFFARMWLASASFASGASLAARVLVGLIAVLSLPISLPMVLIAAVVVGVVNARKQNNQLKEREEAIKTLEGLMPQLEQAVKQQQDDCDAKHDALHQNSDLVEKQLAHLKMIAYQREALKCHKEAIETYFFTHKDQAPTISIALQAIVANSSIDRIEETNQQLSTLAKQCNIEVDVQKIKIPDFKQMIQKEQIEKAKASPAPKPSLWQRFKSGLKKTWGPVSFGLGTGIMLLLILHTIGLALSIPTGGAALAINIAASAAFGVGSSILYAGYQSPYDKKHAALKNKKTALDKQLDMLTSKTDKADKDNENVLREAHNYELMIQDSETLINENLVSLKKDVQVQLAPKPYLSRGSVDAINLSPRPMPDLIQEDAPESNVEKTFREQMADATPEEKAQLLELLRQLKLKGPQAGG